MINQDKNEQCLINRTNHEWRKFKYLIGMLDPNEYIKWRKVFAIHAANRILKDLCNFLYKNNFIQLALFYL